MCACFKNNVLIKRVLKKKKINPYTAQSKSPKNKMIFSPEFRLWEIGRTVSIVTSTSASETVFDIFMIF